MILEPEFIEAVASGKLELPNINEYSFYFETHKALIKAKSDSRFKKINEKSIDATALEDGMYYSDEYPIKYLVFKLGKDFVIFREGDDYHDMHGTNDCWKVINKYFKTNDAESVSMCKGQLMKSYFHYITKSIIPSKMHTRQKKLSIADYNFVKELFNGLAITQFETQESLEAWLEKTDTNEPSNIIIGLNGLLSLHVHSDIDNGFNIILGLKDGIGHLELTYANSRSEFLDFATFYKEACGVEIPYQVKQIIAACFK